MGIEHTRLAPDTHPGSSEQHVAEPQGWPEDLVYHGLNDGRIFDDPDDLVKEGGEAVTRRG
ncbi:hypothetical protein [Roseomonas mucosa]|uniref:hypothetical protein n=1 Tax=Roseomonas mucosa TaxID=207340 RepID=UPI0028CE5740|nr:hypothetical protein [Roseomonas mucosa]MDT8350985.1 hypothetical protein [Roseomonas mucosa]